MHKVFANLELLTAEELNNYLMAQSVISVPNVAARDALPFNQEGALVYVVSRKTLELRIPTYGTGDNAWWIVGGRKPGVSIARHSGAMSFPTHASTYYPFPGSVTFSGGSGSIYGSKRLVKAGTEDGKTGWDVEILVDGMYKSTAQLMLPALAGGSRRVAISQFNVNGGFTTIAAHAADIGVAAVQTVTAQTPDEGVVCLAGDTLTPTFFQNTAGAMIIPNRDATAYAGPFGTFFSVEYVGPL